MSKSLIESRHLLSVGEDLLTCEFKQQGPGLLVAAGVNGRTISTDPER